MQVFKTSEIAENVRLVLSLTDGYFFEPENIESAIGAVGYAAKECLRLTESVTGYGQIMGQVMILDLHIPLYSTNSRDVEDHFNEFRAKVYTYLAMGVQHRRAKETLGGFGDNLELSWVSQEPTRSVTVNFETTKTDTELNRMFEVNGITAIKIWGK